MGMSRGMGIPERVGIPGGRYTKGAPGWVYQRGRFIRGWDVPSGGGYTRGLGSEWVTPTTTRTIGKRASYFAMLFGIIVPDLGPGSDDLM